MKRLTVLILFIFIIMNICACGNKQEDKNTASPTNAASDSDATPSAGETTPAPGEDPDEQNSSSAVVSLSFEKNGNIGSVFAIDSETALIQYGTMGTESGDNLYEEKLALYDLKNDILVKEIPTKSCNKEKILGIDKSGSFLTWDEINAKLYFYKSDLSFEKEVGFPWDSTYREIVFDKENDSLFYAVGNSLYEFKTDGSMVNSTSFNDEDAITAFDIESGLLAYESSDEKFGKKYTLYDTKTSTVLHSEGTAAEKYLIHDKQLYIQSYRPVPDETGEKIVNHSILSAYDSEYTSPYAVNWDDYKDFTWKNGTDYAFATLLASGNAESFIYTLKPVFIDPSNGKTASPELNCDEITDFRLSIFPETGKYLLAVAINPEEFRGNDGFKDIRLFIIDPSLLSYEESFTPAKPDSEENITEQYEANLKTLQNMADAIADKYGITVVFGDESLEIYGSGGVQSYDLTSTTTPNDSSAEVSAMLNKIKNDLSIYPEGFTDHFKNDNEESGLRIMVVKNIASLSGTFVPAGFAEHVYDWYNIYIDTQQAGDNNPSLHHEMWHTIENRIENDDMTAFDSGEWWPLNSPGFEGYVYSTESYGEADNPFNGYFLDNGDLDFNKDAYYVRDYSTVNDKEDRATLIELLHNQSLGDDCFSSAEAMSEYPHLKAKLDFMGEKMASVFGKAYWEK